MSGAEPSSPTKKEKHRFEITKKLGSGTYGKVSLAYDHKFDREVCPSSHIFSKTSIPTFLLSSILHLWGNSFGKRREI